MKYRRPTSSDFEKIVNLQNRNIASSLNQSEKKDGFLSAQFSTQQFQDMDNDLCVIVCEDGESLIAYTCASTLEFNKSIPIVAAMLSHFSKITYRNQPLSNYHSFIYGPVCIDKPFRGKGVLLALSNHLLQFMQLEHPQLSLLTTFIAIENKRSINAHEKLGMENIGQFEFKGAQYCILGRVIS